MTDWLVKKNRLLRVPHAVYGHIYFLIALARNARRRRTVKYPYGLYNIELTNRCPMKCTMCPRTYDMTREQGYMDFGVFKKIIDELTENNHDDYVKNKREIWLHHFGESLLHPEFDKFIRYASDKQLYVCLSTNPIMLTDDNCLKLIAAKPSLLYLSLDGHDDESFFKIRGMKNAYTKSKENILKFLELKSSHNSGIKAVVSMINFQQNEESIGKARSFWENQPSLDGLLIKSFINWNGGVGEINSLSTRDNSYNYRPPILDNIVTCNYPWETMSITWDGDVVPCCYDYDKKYVLGNIRRSPLSEIWNNERMMDLRTQFIDNRITNSLCAQCRELHAVHPLWGAKTVLMRMKVRRFVHSLVGR